VIPSDFASEKSHGLLPEGGSWRGVQDFIYL
jgi:hypothetical protein